MCSSVACYPNSSEKERVDLNIREVENGFVLQVSQYGNKLNRFEEFVAPDRVLLSQLINTQLTVLNLDVEGEE